MRHSRSLGGDELTQRDLARLREVLLQVLWGVLNPYTGHRLVQLSPTMGQSYF